jgi:hypothetical protein
MAACLAPTRRTARRVRRKGSEPFKRREASGGGAWRDGELLMEFMANYIQHVRATTARRWLGAL